MASNWASKVSIWVPAFWFGVIWWYNTFFATAEIDKDKILTKFKKKYKDKIR
jgi:hypothetical protein